MNNLFGFSVLVAFYAGFQKTGSILARIPLKKGVRCLVLSLEGGGLNVDTMSE